MARIRKAIAAIALAALAAGAFGADQNTSTSVVLGEVVAVVNDDVITRHELDDRVAGAIRTLQKQGTPLPAHQTLEQQLLESMIMDMLLAQAAKDAGVRVDDDQLEKALRRIAQENQFASLDAFRAQLKKEGVEFRKFREEVRKQMISARLREREVDSNLFVSDSEVDNFLAAEGGQAGKGEEYHVAHILVVIPEQASAEKVQASQKRASEALAQLRGGASFAQVAAGYSDAQDALHGGDLGWRPAEQIPAGFREVLAKMQPGEVSGLVHSPTAYHIFKLIERRHKDEAMVITQTHVRHILIKTSDLVPDAEAKSRILEIKKHIEEGAGFAEEAKLHSEDGSASQGGDLGWVSPGELVPEFEKVMNNLQPGEMSGPVQTSFGWHLIQVLDRRNADVSEEQKRQRARMALRSIKSDEAWQDWLRQLRDRGHIEYRGEFAH